MTTAQMPERIQLRRNKGWRKPEGVIVVARRSSWGNPYAVGAALWVEGPNGRRNLGHVRDRAHAVDLYLNWLQRRGGSPRTGFNEDCMPPTLTEIEQLRGHDLACWCALDEPCHADVLLELANQVEDSR